MADGGQGRVGAGLSRVRARGDACGGPGRGWVRPVRAGRAVRVVRVVRVVPLGEGSAGVSRGGPLRWADVEGAVAGGAGCRPACPSVAGGGRGPVGPALPAGPPAGPSRRAEFVPPWAFVTPAPAAGVAGQTGRASTGKRESRVPAGLFVVALGLFRALVVRVGDNPSAVPVSCPQAVVHRGGGAPHAWAQWWACGGGGRTSRIWCCRPSAEAVGGLARCSARSAARR